jgi:PTS system N-acetylglucosamine-specific IIC component
MKLPRLNLEGAQRLGRALMLPIAVLPVAGLLLRLGQPDLLNIAWMATAGDAIFSNLGLLFAIGVAVGFARENHGAAGLAAVVGYVVTTKGAEVLLAVPPDAVANFEGAARDLAVASWKAREIAKLSVPVGILSGLVAGALYNRYSDIKLPAYLAFFGGRRFVPIAAGFTGLLLAAAFGYGYPQVEHGMDLLSHAVLDAGGVGLFIYGVLNRLLIVTGLHHILNNLAWFLLGDYNGVTGDLKRFFAGDPVAGRFMSGFFPVMMFGLPGACLAMYRTARPERRLAVGGLLLSMALTSFLTGVTEPIEFTFMFLAPVLYAVHAVLTGTAMVLMHWLHVRLGFGFSAGLFDYVLNFKLAERPLWLLPVGAVYFALYFALFRWAIVRFNLATPGREPVDVSVAPDVAIAAGPALAPLSTARRDVDADADAFVRALGGVANLRSIDACTTRLRLEVADQAVVDEAALRRLGAHGLVRPSATALQVVLGPVADQVAERIRRAARATGRPSGAAANASAIHTPSPSTVDRRHAQLADTLLAALGGRTNVGRVAALSSPVRVRVRDDSAVDAQALTRASPRGCVNAAPGAWHVLVGPDANQLAEAMRSTI